MLVGTLADGHICLELSNLFVGNSKRLLMLLCLQTRNGTGDLPEEVAGY
jgi:hypothetical protein